MGLDCLPQPYDKDGCPIEDSNGMVHQEDESCPFKPDGFPVGIVAPCCSLRGKVAARELAALGEEQLAERMYDDMKPEQTLSFAGELRAMVERLEQKHARVAHKPKGAGWDGRFDPNTEEITWQTFSTFDEAVTSIREAARWYEKIGSLGYGVHAWY